jgi:hypothetical protein
LYDRVSLRHITVIITCRNAFVQGEVEQPYGISLRVLPTAQQNDAYLMYMRIVVIWGGDINKKR